MTVNKLIPENIREDKKKCLDCKRVFFSSTHPDQDWDCGMHDDFSFEESKELFKTLKNILNNEDNEDN